MGSKIDTSHVVKLDGKNYSQWKLQASLVLKAAGAWDIITGTSIRPSTTGDPQLAWDALDIKAQAIMVPLLDVRQTSHINSCTTSKAIWDKLLQINSDSSVLNKQHTLAKFYNYRITPGQSIIEAYGEVEDLSRSLRDMGMNMDESAVTTKIVSALSTHLTEPSNEHGTVFLKKNRPWIVSSLDFGKRSWILLKPKKSRIKKREQQHFLPTIKAKVNLRNFRRIRRNRQARNGRETATTVASQDTGHVNVENRSKKNRVITVIITKITVLRTQMSAMPSW